MDKKEAKDILTKELTSYRKRSYKELLYLLNNQDTAQVRGLSGNLYQLEFEAVWDNKIGGNLRVIGSIDDGGISAFIPLTEDFILSPDDSFIGE
jgi:hypothetical protein